MTRIQYEGRKDIINSINMYFSFPHSTTNALHVFWTEQKWKIEEYKKRLECNLFKLKLKQHVYALHK